MAAFISLREIFEIYQVALEGLREDSQPGEFDAFEKTFPRDPIYIARGLQAAFGLKISIAPVDFYANLDIPEERRDFLSFYEYAEPDHQITIFINTNKSPKGAPLISKQTLRFIVLKELFNAVIRAAIHRRLIKTSFYPDTVEFAAFIAAHLDWISEKFSVYAFEEDEYALTVTIENAAELLAVMFLVNIPELYFARRALGVKPKAFWKLPNGNDLPAETETADLKFSLFEYEKYAEAYAVKVRFIIVLIKTDFILKIVDGLKSIVDDIKKIFTFFPDE